MSPHGETHIVKAVVLRPRVGAFQNDPVGARRTSTYRGGWAAEGPLSMHPTAVSAMQGCGATATRPLRVLDACGHSMLGVSNRVNERPEDGTTGAMGTSPPGLGLGLLTHGLGAVGSSSCFRRRGPCRPARGTARTRRPLRPRPRPGPPPLPSSFGPPRTLLSVQHPRSDCIGPSIVRFALGAAYLATYRSSPTPPRRRHRTRSRDTS